jgi:hypothetical protein
MAGTKQVQLPVDPLLPSEMKLPLEVTVTAHMQFPQNSRLLVVSPSCAPAMGWAMREATPATVPLPTDLSPLEIPAHPSLGLRVEKRVENISEASASSASDGPPFDLPFAGDHNGRWSKGARRREWVGVEARARGCVVLMVSHHHHRASWGGGGDGGVIAQWFCCLCDHRRFSWVAAVRRSKGMRLLCRCRHGCL